MQSALTFALVLLALLYLFRGTLKSALGRGCASGCGSCKSSGCPVNKLQAIQKDLENAKPKKRPA